MERNLMIPLDKIASSNTLFNPELARSIASGAREVADAIVTFGPDLVVVEDLGSLVYETVNEKLAQNRHDVFPSIGCYLTGEAASETERIVTERGGIDCLLSDDGLRAKAIAEILQTPEVNDVVRALKEDSQERGLVDQPIGKITIVGSMENEGMSVLAPIVVHEVYGNDVVLDSQTVITGEAALSWVGQIIERVFPGLKGLELASNHSEEDRRFYEASMSLCMALICGRQATIGGFCWTIESAENVAWLMQDSEKPWEDGGYGISDFSSRFCDYFGTNIDELGQVPQIVKQAIRHLV